MAITGIRPASPFSSSLTGLADRDEKPDQQSLGVRPARHPGGPGAAHRGGREPPASSGDAGDLHLAGTGLTLGIEQMALLAGQAQCQGLSGLEARQTVETLGHGAFDTVHVDVGEGRSDWMTMGLL